MAVGPVTRNGQRLAQAKELQTERGRREVTVQWLEAGEEFPPPGRTRVDWDEAKDLLVRSPHFSQSRSRATIWDGLERYLMLFIELEDSYASLLAGQDLVHALWLGGSYVSSKVDPNNLDVCVITNVEAKMMLAGKPGSKWFTKAFYRDGMLRDYSLSPLEIPYAPVVSPFRAHDATPDGNKYLRERGAWDDWFQRCRLPGMSGQAPTLDTVHSVRGYLEVAL